MFLKKEKGEYIRESAWVYFLKNFSRRIKKRLIPMVTCFVLVGQGGMAGRLDRHEGDLIDNGDFHYIQHYTLMF